MFEQLKAYCLKTFVRLCVHGCTLKDMKVPLRIIALIAVNVVYHISVLGTSNEPMFHHTTATIASETLGIHCNSMGPVGLGSCCGSPNIREYQLTANGLCYVSSTKLCSWLHASGLMLVGKKWVSMLPPHEIVPHTHFAGSYWSFAMRTIPPNLLAAPSIFSRPVSLHTLVVHQAKSVCCVALFTPFYRACFHSANVRNIGPRYKALGNSWAVPVVRYIGEQIKRVSP